MKPRMLASIGAVLLYLWCEFFQVSPFAFLDGWERTVSQRTVGAAATEPEDEPREELAVLFTSARLKE